LLFSQIIACNSKLKACDIMAQGIIGLIRYYYQQSKTPPPKAHPGGMKKLSVLH
jgi:hypothetical protein